jgi:hypothetical protein
MAQWHDVHRLALALPQTERLEGRDGLHSWRVQGKNVVWERPLRRTDLEALGDSAPTGAVLGARVPDLGAKEALLASAPEVYFTTAHFDGYPAVLVRLKEIDEDQLRELITEAWLSRAPRRLVKAFLEQRRNGSEGAAPAQAG